MGITATKLIKTGLAEVGYTEKASNANLDSKNANAGSANFTKYARDLFKAGYYNGNKQGFAWCDPWVDWTFWMACNKNKKEAEYIQCQTGNLGAGCGYSLNYYKAAGRFDKNPKIGDQIFFKYTNDSSIADHTGIVIRITDNTIETVEGNSNNQVRRKCYRRNYKAIIGYGHPRYDPEETEIVKTAKIEMPILKQGSKGAEVKTLQRILRQLNYVNTNGKTLIEVDGKFGLNTEAAVKRYQKNHGSTACDGVVGAWTWGKLLKS